MLRRVKGAVVVRCCWRQLCTGCCVCVRFPSDLRASRCGDSRGGAQQGWAGPVSPLAAGGRGDTEGQTGERGTGSAPSCSPALPAECGTGIFSCRNLMGTPQWGVPGYRISAAMVSSSCWVCLTWIYAVAFCSPVNVYHPQLHMVMCSSV